MITVVDAFGQVVGYIDEAAIPDVGGDGTGGGFLEFLTVLGLIVLVVL
jgi:hypothetical protein